jgi:hypothetical protein
MHQPFTPQIQQLLKDDPKLSGCASGDCWNHWMHSAQDGAAGRPFHAKPSLDERFRI